MEGKIEGRGTVGRKERLKEGIQGIERKIEGRSTRFS